MCWLLFVIAVPSLDRAMVEFLAWDGIACGIVCEAVLDAGRDVTPSSRLANGFVPCSTAWGRTHCTQGWTCL